jgi:stage IV sporulation protein B
MNKNLKKSFKKAIIIFCLTIAVVGIGGIFVNEIYFQETSEVQEAVEVVSEKVLIPGGQSIGIRMNVKGVLVVGLEEIETENDVVSPGYDAGIQVGDMILSINDTDVYYADEVTEIVENSKETLNIQVSRNDDLINFKVTPVKDLTTGQYKIGVWVKEKIAGIGTLSFYDPDTNVLAALGHGIYESKTNTLINSGEGELLKTEVKSIKESENGIPGEIRGIFYERDTPLGDIIKNSSYGVYSIGKDVDADTIGTPMVMATQDQIEVGPAYIITTIDGETPEKFEIEITKVNKQKSVDSKGIEIQVTDERLLSYCGGIVQGMSGSPIIQNNRIVGAVTHVFVNNPTKGYGIFAEWMVEESKTISN